MIPPPFRIQTEADFRARFPDEAACVEYLKASKWPYGFVCPRCGHHEAYELNSRKLFQCTHCRHQTSLIANTLMQDTKLPLLKWFIAIFLICASMDSITAKALERRLEVSYRTAWHLLHRIREALSNPLAFVPFEGQVIIGAVPFNDVVNTSTWRTAGRTDEPVVAVLAEHPKTNGYDNQEREGLALALLTIIDPLKDDSVVTQISSHIGPGTEILPHNNETFRMMPEKETAHPLTTPKKSPKFISLIQRVKGWLTGVFHGSVGRHLQRYLNEFGFRLNRWRVRGQIFAMVLGRIVSTQPLTYESLTDSRGWLVQQPNSDP